MTLRTQCTLAVVLLALAGLALGGLLLADDGSASPSERQVAVDVTAPVVATPEMPPSPRSAVSEGGTRWIAEQATRGPAAPDSERAAPADAPAAQAHGRRSVQPHPEGPSSTARASRPRLVMPSAEARVRARAGAHALESSPRDVQRMLTHMLRAKEREERAAQVRLQLGVERGSPAARAIDHLLGGTPTGMFELPPSHQDRGARQREEMGRLLGLPASR